LLRQGAGNAPLQEEYLISGLHKSVRVRIPDAAPIISRLFATPAKIPLYLVRRLVVRMASRISLAGLAKEIFLYVAIELGIGGYQPHAASWTCVHASI